MGLDFSTLPKTCSVTLTASADIGFKFADEQFWEPGWSSFAVPLRASSPVESRKVRDRSALDILRITGHASDAARGPSYQGLGAVRNSLLPQTRSPTSTPYSAGSLRWKESPKSTGIELVSI